MRSRRRRSGSGFIVLELGYGAFTPVHDDDALDLASLGVGAAPEIVRPAIRRFRRRVMLRASIAATVTVALLVTGVALWPREGDVQALREATGWAPKGGWDADALTVFAKGRLPGDFDWRAYTWTSRKGIVCWGVLVQHRRPVVGCQVDGRVEASPEGFPGVAVLTRTDTGGSDPFIPQTVVAGVVPAEIQRVGLKIYDKANEVREHRLSTYPKKGVSVRFFAIVLGEDVASLNGASIEAFDPTGKSVLARRVDARTNTLLTPEARDAATIAVEAGGDAGATPTEVNGPLPLTQALEGISNTTIPHLGHRHSRLQSYRGGSLHSFRRARSTRKASSSRPRDGPGHPCRCGYQGDPCHCGSRFCHLTTPIGPGMRSC